ncbi:MAG TPA: LacI family transcriptional regulator [Firmicutes bacterium]|nr:LacI family transcriptional regulator [Bacillota bacterium]
MTVTIRDIAKAANVSVATVSKVLNNKESGIPISEKTRERILRIAEELQYRPNIWAKRLASNCSNVVGVLIDTYLIFSSTINAQILQGIGECLDDNGYSLELLSKKGINNITDYLRDLVLSRRIDALLVWINDLDQDFCRYLDQQGIPHCHVQRYPASKECSGVMCDNLGGSYMATKYLIEHGHHNIMTIIDLDHIEGKYRLEGYKKALAEYSIPYNPDLVIEGIYRGTVDESTLDITKFKKALAYSTAVFSTSDYLAIRATKLITELTGEPRPVIGFDGLDIMKHYQPPIPTVVQDGYRMGMVAAERVLKALGNETLPPEWIFVPTSLRIP